MIVKAVVAIILCPAGWIVADDTQLKRRDPLPQNGVSEFRIDQGKRIPVKLLTTVSLDADGHPDRADLQTVFPVIVSGHTVIPAGSYLDAEVTGMHRRVRTKGQTEFSVRLSRLMLPGGKHQELHGCLGTMTATTVIRGSTIVIVPGTIIDIILQDPIVFPIEQERQSLVR